MLRVCRQHNQPFDPGVANRTPDASMAPNFQASKKRFSSLEMRTCISRIGRPVATVNWDSHLHEITCWRDTKSNTQQRVKRQKQKSPIMPITILEMNRREQVIFSISVTKMSLSNPFDYFTILGRLSVSGGLLSFVDRASVLV